MLSNLKELLPYPFVSATAEDVTEFLLRNEEFLDDFVLEHVENARIQKWVQRSESQETITASTVHSNVCF